MIRANRPDEPKLHGGAAGTPELQAKIIEGVKAEAAERSLAELAAERDRVVLGLLALLARRRAVH